MRFLSPVTESLSATAGNILSALVESVRTVFEGDAETRRAVSFSVAMIALSAKMAKADGVVTKEEVDAFQEIFLIPQGERKHVERLYNLARQDVAGFESYARTMADLCGSGTGDCPILEDILDGLFHIAKADGALHENELAFLQRIAEIFRMDEVHFRRISARHVGVEDFDPYLVLGIDPDTPFDEVRRQYAQLMRENHPDRLLARGVPAEFMAIATERAAALNAAYEAIERDRRAA